MEGKRQKAKEKNEIIKQKRDRGRREEKAQRFSPYLPPLTMLHTQLHEITKPNLSNEIICEASRSPPHQVELCSNEHVVAGRHRRRQHVAERVFGIEFSVGPRVEYPGQAEGCWRVPAPPCHATALKQ